MSTRTSATIGVLSAALLAAQKSFENVTFDSTNPHFKNKYAGLPGVVEEIKPKLNAQGIALFQFPTEAPEGHLGLVTRLQHESGEFIEATAVVPLPKADPQGFGSAMTYTRRYSLLSICGVVGEPDDDANNASGGGQKSPPREAPSGGGFFKKPDVKTEAKPEQAKAPEKKKGGLFPTPKQAAKREEADIPY